MAGRIRQDDIDAVRQRSEIVKVVSGYLQLKKAGRDSMVGLCPFHGEKTGSFNVSPSKQVYHCFGCGEGGDVFRFLQKVENLSFSEAVEHLAKEAGIVVRYEGQTPAERRATGHRQTLYRANAEAARLYQRMLLEGHEGGDAREYLQARGISKESVERFEVGYAPGYHDFLLKRLSKSYSPELLVEAGLVADAGGALKDRFRGRVTFPIHDLSGNAVGIGGRLLQPKGRPPVEAAKYVNSPETPVYRKGSLLYNLNRAKADATRLGRAFMVEGYTDVIALDQAGVPAVVASCGTALGEEHLRLLSRFTDRVVLAFDSDDAGARAAERAFQFHQEHPIDVLVLILPAGQDPADFVLANKGGAGEAFLELSSRAAPLVEYMIDRLIERRDLADLEERPRAVRDCVPMLAQVEDEGRRNEYVRLLAGRVGMSAHAVQQQVDGARGETGAPAPPQLRRIPPEHRVEREALKILVQGPHKRAANLVKLGPEHFTKAEHQKVLEFIREYEQATAGVGAGAAETAGLVARAGERSEQLERVIAALAVEPLEAEESPGQLGEERGNGNGNGDGGGTASAHAAGPTSDYTQAVFLRLEEFALKRRADEVRKQAERINPEKHPADHEALFEQLLRLETERRRVREAAEAIGSGL